MEREVLEGRLRAIQDLKTEYYIGSEEAYNFLKNCRNIYEAPTNISKLINEKLRSVEKISYTATPERIMGLSDVLINVSDSCLEFTVEEPDKIDLSDLYLSENFENFKFLDSVKIDIFSSRDKEKSSKIIYPFFEYANQEKVTSNLQFGKCVPQYVFKEYEKIKSLVDGYRFNLEYMGDYIRTLGEVNWEYVLSKEHLRMLERQALEGEKSQGIRNTLIVERLFKDQVDHRLENRRMVLCKFLVDSKAKNYDAALKIVNRRLIERTKRLKKLEGLNPPRSVLESEKRLVKEAEFIRHLIGPEKNFINRFLIN